MPEQDWEKLLGGFATDTLTAEERQWLYTAALQDQQVFNALADEQALKELLSDPVVRRRLLSALRQTSASTAGGARSWLDWSRRPAGLAFAGGIAAAALAVVLGTQIYRDSLRHRASSLNTEETKPASPSEPTGTPFRKPEENVPAYEKPARISAEKQALSDKMAKHEQSPTKESADAPRDAVTQRPEQDTHRNQTLARRESTKGAEDAMVATDQQLAPTTPSAAISGLRPAQSPATAPVTPAAGSPSAPISARSLYYSTAPQPLMEHERPPSSATREEIRSNRDHRAEALQQERTRADRHSGSLGKTEGRTSSDKLLGIRYSVIMNGPGGIDMEVDPSTPVGKEDLPRLSVQTNESGYLSAHYVSQVSDTVSRLFPLSGEARLTAHNTIGITLAEIYENMGSGESVRVLVVFSRVPGVASAALTTDNDTSGLRIEKVEPGQAGAPAEQAVYIVAPHPHTETVQVAIPLFIRP